MRARSLPAVALAALLASPLLAACSGGLGDDFSVEDALTELPPAPSGEELVTVRAADLAAATDLAGTDPDDEDWLRSLVGGRVFVPLPVTSSRRPGLGVDLPDVASYASMQAGGGETLDVFRLRDGDPPSDDGDVGDLARETDDDVTALATSEDLLDRWRDREDTLVDDEAFGALAEALDDHDVYAALLTTAPGDGGVLAFGVGQAVEDDEVVEYAVFALDDDEDAGERAEDIEESWTATSVVEDGRLEVDEVDTRGQVVVVRMLAEEAGTTYAAMITNLDFRVPE